MEVWGVGLGAHGWGKCPSEAEGNRVLASGCGNFQVLRSLSQRLAGPGFSPAQQLTQRLFWANPLVPVCHATSRQLYSHRVTHSGTSKSGGAKQALFTVQ
jgi:hypothetical protein